MKHATVRIVFDTATTVPDLNSCGRMTVMVIENKPLRIGALLFDGIDQIDFTGPFEVLARLPNATFRTYGLAADPVRDVSNLRLTPDGVLEDAPSLDVLHIPGGFGQEALMDDTRVINWIAKQAAGATFVFSVCTGALLCGAAGLLRGRRATTHWSAHALLSHFGAVHIDERVVIDGNLVTAAGVTAGIDGALRLAALLRGDDVARLIQLQIAYAPEPPFDSGTPATAPPAVFQKAKNAVHDITTQREQTARRIAGRLGIA